MSTEATTLTQATDIDVEEVIERYHRAIAEFPKGRPEPVKALFTRRDDVLLANPFGPAVHGWERVSATLDYASSRFSEGTVFRFDRLATYVAADLATIHETEHCRARVGGGSEIVPFDLRVTSTFRREEGTWKLVHRHADPITAPNPEGPLRTTNT